MAAPHTPKLPALAVLVGLIGAVAAAVLGLLTFGAQASARPDHVPLGVVAPAGSPVASQLAGQGGDLVEWRLSPTAAAATKALEDKEIYGYLDLTTQPAEIVVSGAINPQGAQIAQQVLTEIVHKANPTVETVVIHPVGLAGRTAPLAASALLWICGLVAIIAFTVLIGRFGLKAGIGPRALVATSVTVFGTATVIGFFALWDNNLPLNWSVIGFLALTALAFAAIQGALLRLFGIRAAAILGPLYLIAPAVAGQVPELINPTYRALLWSWTPFRFSTEGLRSLLQGTPSAPDVRLGVIVLASMAVAGLTVLVLTNLRQEAQPEPADGIVHIGVDEADGLPGAQHELPAEHRNGGVRR
jgi:hypothetical protein